MMNEIRVLNPRIGQNHRFLSELHLSVGTVCISNKDYTQQRLMQLSE